MQQPVAGRGDDVPRGPQPVGAALGAAMVDATAAAQRAAAALPYDPLLDVGPGACTFVAAVVLEHMSRKQLSASLDPAQGLAIETIDLGAPGRDDRTAGACSGAALASLGCSARLAVDGPAR